MEQGSDLHFISKDARAVAVLRGWCVVRVVCLQAVLQVLLHGSDDLERAGASHVLAAFCHDNNLGQMAVLSTVVHAGEYQAGFNKLQSADRAVGSHLHSHPPNSKLTGAECHKVGQGRPPPCMAVNCTTSGVAVWALEQTL